MKCDDEVDDDDDGGGNAGIMFYKYIEGQVMWFVNVM